MKPTARPKKPRRLLNADSEAAQAAELAGQFHQRRSEKIREIEEEVQERTELAELGGLVSLEVATERAGRLTLEPAPGIRVAASADGGQLYFVGGDQALELEKFRLSAEPKDYVVLGTLCKIVYDTRKGFHNFERIHYVHRMGEDGGKSPTLCYDVLNRRIFVVGGTYRVRREGIVH